jgi:hypothetical protein
VRQSKYANNKTIIVENQTRNNPALITFLKMALYVPLKSWFCMVLFSCWFVGGFILAHFLRCFVTSKQKATNKTQIQKEAT